MAADSAVNWYGGTACAEPSLPDVTTRPDADRCGRSRGEGVLHDVGLSGHGAGKIDKAPD
jgi:hypothetical protein